MYAYNGAFSDEEVQQCLDRQFERNFWHKGYATEAAIACKEYAFTKIGAGEVCSIIRDTNQASQNVALRNGMKIKDTAIKHYRGEDMKHFRYKEMFLMILFFCKIPMHSVSCIFIWSFYKTKFFIERFFTRS